jgi:hypothetical protein
MTPDGIYWIAAGVVLVAALIGIGRGGQGFATRQRRRGRWAAMGPLEPIRAPEIARGAVVAGPRRRRRSTPGRRAEARPPNELQLKRMPSEDRRRIVQALVGCAVVVASFVGCGLAYRRFAPAEWADRASAGPATDDCSLRYRRARTAADTAIVDRLDVGNWRGHQICSIMRHRADALRAEAGAHVRSLPRGLTNR